VRELQSPREAAKDKPIKEQRSYGPKMKNVLRYQTIKAVSSCTPIFFFLHPTMLCKDQTVPIIFLKP